ncbi:MAG: exodeoxyribonuclease III [Bacteroidales bacterium]|nr:exodeoxyribonuclease III [Bacteroidales bacterium]
MKIVSWNVNGLRAVIQKDFKSKVEAINPDILCLQETKAQNGQVIAALTDFDTYHIYCNEAQRKGYSGTAVLSKQAPVAVTYGIGADEHDTEGRVITLEFDEFYLVNVYVPNSGSELLRLTYRQEWDMAFYVYLKGLERTKPVVVCGDFNVAHKPVDIARPKDNYNKAAGYMQEEIDGMDRYVAGGLVDTFRFLHPDARDAYSWWSFRAAARQRNIGWRIDYFLISNSIKDRLSQAFILPDVDGSDHCPVGIWLN